MTKQRRLVWAAVALFSVLCARDAAARGEQEIVNDAPRPHIEVPLARTTPLVTAMADDPAWSGAAAIPLNTLSLSPVPPPAAPIPETEIQLLWDPAWLYVRFLCRDGEPYLPFHGHGAPIYKGDVVEVFLDPVGDCRQWFELEFNAANDVFTQLTLCTGEPKWDRGLHLTNEFIDRDTWSFPNEDLKNLRTAASPWKINGQAVGWIVDVAIPASETLKRTGLKKFQAMSLRGNFLRYKSILAATSASRELLSLTWSPTVFGAPHRCPAAFGFIDLSSTTK